jgi:hydroxyacylglutathione hydrolase
MPMTLVARSVGPWPMNTYALICPHTGESVLFDPGADPDALEQMLAGSTPIAIILTHTHPDHVGALDEMRSRLDVPLLAHPGPHFQGLELPGARPIADGERIAVGQHTLLATYTPGHIADMISFSVEGDSTVIVGDTIFAGGPGRTWSAADFQTTLRTLKDIILSWPDDAVCYPGHGPEFRLGDLRPQIEVFVARDHGEFFGDAEW